jgi:hypothetical protein
MDIGPTSPPYGTLREEDIETKWAAGIDAQIVNTANDPIDNNDVESPPDYESPPD